MINSQLPGPSLHRGKAVLLSCIVCILWIGIYIFIRGVSIFNIDSTAPFFPPALYLFSLAWLWVLPVFYLSRSFYKDRLVFSIQIVIYVAVLSVGFFNSYALVKNSWPDFCPEANMVRGLGLGPEPQRIWAFYQDYCQTHPVSDVLLLKRAFGYSLGVGGTYSLTIFYDPSGYYRAPSGSTVVNDFAPYIIEAQKAEQKYLYP